jgi:hypothetical protein
MRIEHVLRAAQKTPHVEQKLIKIQSILLGTQPEQIVVGCAAKNLENRI